MGQILFFLYIVQVLDTISAKENADILTPDQSSGLLIASSDKGKNAVKVSCRKG